jgi:hypothetical protein
MGLPQCACGRQVARREQEGPSFVSVLAALLPPAFDMRCSLSSCMSTAWSLSVKALAFVVLACLARRCWPPLRRRRGERRSRHLPNEHGVEPRGVQPADVPVDRSRVDRIKTLQRRVRASSRLPLSLRIELREALESLKSHDADDARALAAWQRLRDAAPEIWDASKPILDALMGESAKKALESSNAHGG